MLLPHLLPYLDAEIERLQKARDLLALPSCLLLDTFDSEQAAHTLSIEVQPLLDTAAQKLTSKPAAAVPLVSKPEAPVVSVRVGSRTRRTEMPDHALRAGSRKRVMLSDTALRGLVPTGPVVVSAEEVRKSQASKTAQSTRAAEVRRAGTELVSSFNWRSQASDGRSMDSLLQRLMNIGEDTGQGNAGQMPSLSRSGSFKPTLALAGSKLD